MITINDKFNYQPLKRTEGPNGRRYIVGEGRPLPSVTTVLSATKDMTHLNEWIDRVGEATANKIKTEASGLGTSLHKNIENYILGKEITGTFMAKALAKVIINKGLPSVTEVWGTEVALYSTGLYAGTADLLGLHDGKPAVMDFKNSLRDKKKEWIEDYFIQLAAYAMAHNEMYGTNINRGVIMIATRDAKYQEFVIESEEFNHYEKLWANKLCSYYDLCGFE